MTIDDDEEEIRINIATKTNPWYFQQCQTAIFKTELASDIKSLILFASTSNLCGGNKIVQYNEHIIQNCLFPAKNGGATGLRATKIHSSYTNCVVQWERICKVHDDFYNKSCMMNTSRDTLYNVAMTTTSASCIKEGKAKQSMTALEAIIDVFMDPAIVPSCFTTMMIIGLLNVGSFIVDSNSSFCTNYQTRIQTLISPLGWSSQNDSGSGSSQIDQQARHERNFVSYQKLHSLRLIKSTIVALLLKRPGMSVSYPLRNFMASTMSVQRVPHMDTTESTSSRKKEIKSFITTNFPTKKLSNMIEMIHFLQSIITQYNKQSNSFTRTTYYTNSSCKMISSHIILQSLIRLLVQIDDLDLLLLRYKEENRAKQIKSNSICKSCRQLFGNKRRKTHLSITSRSQMLHGEQSDDEREQCILDLRRKMKRTRHSSYNQEYLLTPSASSALPLQEIMSSFIHGKTSKDRKSIQDQKSCIVCQIKKEKMKSSSTLFMNIQGKNITTLPIDIVYFRTYLLGAILDVINFHSKCHEQSKSGIVSIEITLRRIMKSVLKRPYSSSLRYLVAFLVLHLPGGSSEGYAQYLNILLQHHLKYNSSSLSKENQYTSLTVYCELVAELSYFDDPNHCWNAIWPLIDSAISYTASQSDDNTASPMNHRVKCLLQCIGYLLLKRNRFLRVDTMNDKTSSCYNKYVIKCSEIFSEPSMWVHPFLTKEEQNEMIFVLQKLGLLSFLNNDFDNEKDYNIVQNTWPFKEGIRDAARRIAAKNMNETMFSTYHQEHRHNDADWRRSIKRKREDSFVEVSIQAYINEDLTRYIFSFLGYKLLVRATGVCKQWNKIGNESTFWEEHYKYRFKLTTNESLLPNDIDAKIRTAFLEKEKKKLKEIYWRRTFDNKWKKERSLRFKVSSDGYKAKTCDMLCCLTLLSTKNRRDKHELVHKKSVMKSIAALSRSKKSAKRK